MQFFPCLKEIKCVDQKIEEQKTDVWWEKKDTMVGEKFTAHLKNFLNFK